MAAKRITIRTCDVHADETPGERYVITYPDGSRSSPDLCAAHAAPLEALRSHAQLKRRTAVVTVDEVKAARTKKAAPVKRAATPRRRTR